MEAEEEVGQFESGLKLHVTGLVVRNAALTVWPVLISPTKAVGLVECDDKGHLRSSIVMTESAGTEWGQRLHLLIAAVRQREISLPALRRNQWATATLSLPDLLSPAGKRVQVCVDSRDWTAHLRVDVQPELENTVAVPGGMQNLDVGLMLAEVFSRMFLGHTLHAREFNL
jgi:hypothetical protein